MARLGRVPPTGAPDRRGSAGLTSARRRPAEAPSAWVDLAVGLCAGLAATQVTNLAQRPLKRATPDSVDREEKRVRPGETSSLVAARKLAGMLDAPPSRHRDEVGGQVIHYAVGMGWGPVYGLLRRHAGLPPAAAALVSGGAMSLLLDEAAVPALDLSAPNRAYPAFTHLRGLVAHLIYGAAVAMAAEGLGHAVGHPPARRLRR